MTRRDTPRPRPIRRAAGALAAAIALAAGGVAVAQQVATVKPPKVPVFSGPSAAYTQVMMAAQGDRLEVLGEQGPWLRVRTRDGRVGFVSKKAMNAPAGTSLDLGAATGTGTASDASANAATKPLRPEAEAYTQSKGFSKDDAERLIKLRDGITGDEWERFAAELKPRPRPAS